MGTDVVALRPGEVFHGRYAVVRRIAAGGMGAVYEVVHQRTQRRCAMKLMLPSLVANSDLRDWVGTDKDGYKTLTIRGFEALAVESFRELKNDSLRRQVTDLAAKAERTAKLTE